MKIISVKLIPKAKKNHVEKLDNYLRVRTTETPEKGKANYSLIKQLAKHFHIAPSKIKIISGTKMRKKLVEIEQ